MNLHPIFVHFPIGLLTLYAVCELIPFRFLTQRAYWFYIKATLVITGYLGSIAALMSGQAIEDDFKVGGIVKLIETHEQWAFISLTIFELLAILYIVSWIARDSGKDFSHNKYVGWLWRFLLKLEYWVVQKRVAIILALFGLLSITITGALGGSIAHGPDIDPAARFFYDLLVK